MTGFLRYGALAVTGALVLGLSGCGGGSAAEPRVLPDPSVAVTPSVSASVSAEPTGINAPTPQGAAAFARYFYSEITRAFAERDPDIVSRLSLPTCKTCKLYVDSISGIRSRGESVRGATFRMAFAISPADTGPSARVDVGWDFAGAQFVDASGRVIDTSKPERAVEEQMELSRVDHSWRVAAIKRVRKR